MREKRQGVKYIAKEGRRPCEHCGIISFSHFHPNGTLPKDFVRIPERYKLPWIKEEKPKPKVPLSKKKPLTEKEFIRLAKKIQKSFPEEDNYKPTPSKECQAEEGNCICHFKYPSNLCKWCKEHCVAPQEKTCSCHCHCWYMGQKICFGHENRQDVVCSHCQTPKEEPSIEYVFSHLEKFNYDECPLWGLNPKKLKLYIKSQLQQVRESLIKEIEEAFEMQEKTHNGWLRTGLSIRLEDWNKFKSKLLSTR